MSAQTAQSKPLELNADKIKAEDVLAKIEAWRKSLVSNKALAQEAWIMSLTHCYQHRTAKMLRDLLKVVETEGKDFVRRAPLTLAYREYAPVKMVTKEIDGKKVKVLEFDGDSKLIEQADAMIAAASEKLWWTMSKDVEPDAFDVVRFDARVLGLANKALKQIEEEGGVDANVVAHVRKVRDEFKTRVEAAKALAA